MTEDHPIRETGRQYAVFMDLLSHDVLNSNQAVLSYLELVLSDPETDAKARSYAEKAISHVRTSTLLVEHAKNLMAVKNAEPSSLRPVDLMRSVMMATKELPRFFPAKKVKVRVVQSPQDPYVLGDILAEDLVLNSFVDLVRADPGDEVEVEVRIVKSERNGKMCWRLVLSDANAVLQPGMKTGDVSGLLTQDSSKLVRMAGFLFASMAANILGGAFEGRELAEDKGKGGEFALTLVKAGKP